MNKVLVQQVLLNKGSLSHRDDDYDYVFLKDIAIPSVQRWAKRNSYDYNLSTQIQPKIEKMKDDWSRPYHQTMRFAFQKYLLLDKAIDYDFIVLIDSDCVIMNHAPDIPILSGVSMRDIDHWRSEESNLKNRAYVSNAGLYIFDKPSALLMCQYIKRRIDEIVLNDEKGFHDEVELARFLDRNLDINANILGDDWNHISTTAFNTANVQCKYIYHYAGGRKHSRWRNMIDNKWIDDQGNWLR